MDEDAKHMLELTLRRSVGNLVDCAFSSNVAHNGTAYACQSCELLGGGNTVGGSSTTYGCNPIGL